MNAALHHYDEEALIELMERGDEAVSRDEHLRACAACADTLASVRDFTDTLKAKEVWEGPELNVEPSDAVLAVLRAAQTRMRSEDEAAEGFVKELLSGPRETWAAKLAEHPEWRTAGTVRKLIAATDRAIETMPPDALEIASLAIEISEKLDPAAYPSGEVATLRVGAWRERAYGLYYIGQYHDAIAAVSKAEEFLHRAADHDGARLRAIRALALCEIEEFNEALALARSAASAFEKLRDVTRFVAARRTEGIVLYRSRRFRDALDVFLTVLRSYSQGLDAHSRPALLQNIAICFREIGDLEQATRYFTDSVIGFEQAGIVTLRHKAVWHLGRVLLAQSRFDEALRVLEGARAGFEECGMANDVAVVTLDVANALLVLGRSSEISEQCRRALDYFASAGLEKTASAATAVMFLREAAAAGGVNTKTIDAARSRIQAPARRQAVIFVPPVMAHEG